MSMSGCRQVWMEVTEYYECLHDCVQVRMRATADQWETPCCETPRPVSTSKPSRMCILPSSKCSRQRQELGTNFRTPQDKHLLNHCDIDKAVQISRVYALHVFKGFYLGGVLCLCSPVDPEATSLPLLAFILSTLWRKTFVNCVHQQIKKADLLMSPSQDKCIRWLELHPGHGSHLNIIITAGTTEHVNYNLKDWQ